MAKYRKLPVEIEAIQHTGDNFQELQDWTGQLLPIPKPASEYLAGTFVVETLEGKTIASLGDYIIKGVNGEFYPCKPDIFEKTYELVEPS